MATDTSHYNDKYHPLKS